MHFFLDSTVRWELLPIRSSGRTPANSFPVKSLIVLNQTEGALYYEKGNFLSFTALYIAFAPILVSASFIFPSLLKFAITSGL